MPVIAHSKQFVTTVTAMPGAKADEPSMMISTTAVDREGDRLLAEGADFTAYRRNPVLLWAHDIRSLPIGTVTALDVVPGQGIRARWRWLEGDEFADRVRNAWSQGVVRAASVGFLPRQAQPNEYRGQDYTAWEALEISLCPVPANQDAVRTLKGLGLIPGGGEVLTFDDAALVEAFTRASPRIAQAVRYAIEKAFKREVRKLTGRVDFDEPVLWIEDVRPDTSRGKGDDVLLIDDRDVDRAFDMSADQIRAKIRQFAAAAVQRALREMREGRGR